MAITYTISLLLYKNTNMEKFWGRIGSNDAQVYGSKLLTANRMQYYMYITECAHK